MMNFCLCPQLVNFGIFRPNPLRGFGSPFGGSIFSTTRLFTLISSSICSPPFRFGAKEKGQPMNVVASTSALFLNLRPVGPGRVLQKPLLLLFGLGFSPKHFAFQEANSDVLTRLDPKLTGWASYCTDPTTSRNAICKSLWHSITLRHHAVKNVESHLPCRKVCHASRSPVARPGSRSHNNCGGCSKWVTSIGSSCDI